MSQYILKVELSKTEIGDADQRYMLDQVMDLMDNMGEVHASVNLYIKDGCEEVWIGGDKV